MVLLKHALDRTLEVLRKLLLEVRLREQVDKQLLEQYLVLVQELWKVRVDYGLHEDVLF